MRLDDGRNDVAGGGGGGGGGGGDCALSNSSATHGGVFPLSGVPY